MNVYTVHLKGSPDDPAAVEAAIFIREGFSWWALLLGPLWLVWNRLWLALIAWLSLEAVIISLGASLLPRSWTIIALQSLMHLALGLEGAQIRRSAAARRGFRLADVVHGRQVTDAERVYFRRAGDRITVGSEQPAGPAYRERQPGMIGLFPSSGA